MTDSGEPLMALRVYELEPVPLIDLPAWMEAHHARKVGWWRTPPGEPWVMEVEVDPCP